MTDLPADRYIEEALRRVNVISIPGAMKWSKGEVIEGRGELRYCYTVLELARTLEQLEKYEPIPEPVDPDLLIAREAVARENEKRGYANVAADYRNGLNDGELEYEVAAIKLAREKGEL